MKKRFFALLLCLMLCCSMASADSVFGNGSVFGVGGTVTITRAEYERLKQYEKLDEVLQYIEAYYYKEPNTGDMMDMAIQGLLAGLNDPYTFYYDAKAWADMWEEEEGEYTGIGLQLLGSYLDYTVTITRVFRDTPAEKVGLRKNDLLVRVEDITVTTETMQNAVNVMRGKVGESVEVEVYRDGEYLTFTVERAAIHTNNVDWCMLDNNVGYLILYQFATESLLQDFKTAMEDLKAQGAKSLVLDLRDNPGGWVNDAVGVADFFLDKKLVVYSRTRDMERTDEQYTKAGADDIPLVVLINGSSASSSEILSGCLQDYGRAVIMGSQSFGKGVMQYVVGLSDNKTGMQFTFCEYFTPNGNSVHGIGITPDIAVEMPAELKNKLFEVGDMADPQLAAAWEEAVRQQK